LVNATQDTMERSQPAHAAVSVERGLRNRITAITFVIMLTVMFVACAGMYSLYRAAMNEEQERLGELANSQVSVIESLARNEKWERQGVVGGAYFDAALVQVRDAFKRMENADYAAELVLGRIRGDRLEFLLRSHGDVTDDGHFVPVDSHRGEPMQRAVSGKSGTMVARDYDGEWVLAAYDPVPCLEAGLVAKVRLEDLRRPYLRAAGSTVALTVILLVATLVILYRVGFPLVRAVERSSDEMARVNEALHAEVASRQHTETSLVAKEKLLRNIIEAIPCTVFWKDRNTVYLGCNDRFAEYAGLTDRDAIVGKTDYDLAWTREEADWYRQCDREVMESGTPLINVEESLRRADGTESAILTSKVPLRNDEGEVTGVLGIFTDITDRRRAEEKLRLQGAALQAAANAIMITDRHGVILWANPAFLTLTGYAVDEVIGASPRILKSGLHPAAFYRILWETVQAGNVWQGEIINRRKDGTDYHEEMTITPMKDPVNGITHFIAVKSDATERKIMEQELRGARENLEQRVIERTTKIEEVNRLLVTAEQIHRSLLDCNTKEQVGRILTDSLVCDFGAYFARMWLIRQGDLCGECAHASVCPTKTQCLHLVASAGRYTHIDGDHRRVPLGAFKIGLIAQGRGKTISNHVSSDERIHDRHWAAEHNLVSFAGLPLVFKDRVIGVIAMFAQRELSPSMLDVLELIGHGASSVLANVEQRQELIRASAAKSEFLANMSHELRTPLNGVITLNDLLLKAPLGPKEARYAQLAKTSANVLLTLINDILDFSKIEAGGLELEHCDFDLQHLVDEVATIIAPMAEGKGLELVASTHPSAPRSLRGDPTRLKQVLTNLLNNAVKFTAHGEVVLRIATDLDEGSRVNLRFSITDTGIGIPPDRQDYIFEKFAQTDSSTTRKYGGTGLGLAICKRIVERMGGHIGVHSSQGVGSTFWFVVTLEKAPSRRPQMAAAPADIRSLRLLVVDDNATNREVMQEQLGSIGLATELAADGEAALQVLRGACHAGEPVHMAILDLHMPEMDGFQLASAIKNDPMLANTVLLLLSSSTESDPDRFRRIGFSGWVVKPVGVSELLSAIVEAYTCSGTVSPDENGDHCAAEFQDNRRSTGMTAHRHILLVEDNAIGQEVAREVLREAGFTCDTADNGLRAVESVLAREYDLVLMDCQMPEMDGFEATRAIRSHEASGRLPGPKGRRLPIIALTANALRGDREKCLDAGMTMYVAKPFEPRKLVEAIESQFTAAETCDMNAPDTESHDECIEDLTMNDYEKVSANDRVPPFELDAVLKRWGGKREFVCKLIHKFLTMAPAELDQLTTHANDGDIAETTRLAHGLKGAASYCGATRFQTIAARLEGMGRDGDLSAAESCVADLRCELERCLAHAPDVASADEGTVDAIR